jgi:hypothetical protein
MPCNRSPTTLPKRVKVMVFNATFNNISVISWQSFFFVEGTGVLGGEGIIDLPQVTDKLYPPPKKCC